MSSLNLSGKMKARTLDQSQKTGYQGEQGLFAVQPSPAWAQPLISRSRDEEAAFHGDYSVMSPRVPICSHRLPQPCSTPVPCPYRGLPGRQVKIILLLLCLWPISQFKPQTQITRATACWEECIRPQIYYSLCLALSKEQNSICKQKQRG